jgi:hypothetical protein
MRAANAQQLINKCDRITHIFPGGRFERYDVADQQAGQPSHSIFATGRAQVNFCAIVHDCCCIRPASGVSTLSTLCLRQQPIHFRNEILVIRRQSPRRKAQQEPGDESDSCNRYDRNPHDEVTCLKVVPFRKTP